VYDFLVHPALGLATFKPHAADPAELVALPIFRTTESTIHNQPGLELHQIRRRTPAKAKQQLTIEMTIVRLRL